MARLRGRECDTAGPAEHAIQPYPLGVGIREVDVAGLLSTGGILIRGGCVLCIVLAALSDFSTRDQQESMPTNGVKEAPRRGSYPGDLSAIVDSERYCQFQAGVTISNQAVQLKDRAVLPQHRTVM